MKLHTYSLIKKFTLRGADLTQIESDISGILKIGSAKIQLKAGEITELPSIADGIYVPILTDDCGDTYEGNLVTVRYGRIAPPSKSETELFDLKCKYDELALNTEQRFEVVDKAIRKLENIFDTNSLNFLIK